MAAPKRPWTSSELRTLRTLAKLGYPAGVVALRLGRSLSGVQQKAAAEAISFGAGQVGRRSLSEA